MTEYRNKRRTDLGRDWSKRPPEKREVYLGGVRGTLGPVGRWGNCPIRSRSALRKNELATRSPTGTNITTYIRLTSGGRGGAGGGGSQGGNK